MPLLGASLVSASQNSQMHIGRAMKYARVPKVLLLIAAKDLSVIAYEVCHIDELVILALGVLMALDNGSWHDADVVLSG